MEKQYWNIKEVSEFSGFPVKTLYNWINLNKIPYHKINGAVRFHITQTVRFFESKEVKPKKVA